MFVLCVRVDHSPKRQTAAAAASRCKGVACEVKPAVVFREVHFAFEIGSALASFVEIDGGKRYGTLRM